MKITLNEQAVLLDALKHYAEYVDRHPLQYSVNVIITAERLRKKIEKLTATQPTK